jgi:hypothetical protein
MYLNDDLYKIISAFLNHSADTDEELFKLLFSRQICAKKCNFP